MMKLRLNAFGRRIDIERIGDAWVAFYPGADGKKRRAHDVMLPPDLKRDDVAEYIADLLHEWANDRFNAVEILDVS
jgi:hypothetical protein